MRVEAEQSQIGRFDDKLKKALRVTVAGVALAGFGSWSAGMYDFFTDVKPSSNELHRQTDDLFPRPDPSELRVANSLIADVNSDIDRRQLNREILTINTLLQERYGEIEAAQGIIEEEQSNISYFDEQTRKTGLVSKSKRDLTMIVSGMLGMFVGLGGGFKFQSKRQ